MKYVEIGEDESGKSLRGRDHAESDVDIVGNDAETGLLAFTDEVGALEDEFTTYTPMECCGLSVHFRSTILAVGAIG